MHLHGNLKSRNSLRGRSYRIGLFRRGRSRGGAVHLADLEPRESAHRDVLAQLRDRLIDQLFDRDAFVLDEMLFVEAILFVEFLHLAADDFLNHILAVGIGLRRADGVTYSVFEVL